MKRPLVGTLCLATGYALGFLTQQARGELRVVERDALVLRLGLVEERLHGEGIVINRLMARANTLKEENAEAVQRLMLKCRDVEMKPRASK